MLTELMQIASVENINVMLNRLLYHNILANIHKQKVSLLLGARRVGKTELLQKIATDSGKKVLQLNGEDADAATLLANRTTANYKRLLEGYELLIIDEAQFISDVGRKVKLMIDTIKPLHIILTGSSAFDLVNQSEPLVGRTITYQLYPLAQTELKAYENALETTQKLEEKLIYGCYPEVYTLPTVAEKQAYLNELVNTYLLKDLLVFEEVRQSNKIYALLQLLAFQVGGEVSYEELGRQLQISKNTVERYVDLLSKVFIIYQRKGFSKNLRKEIVKTSKWYFTDNGVRNAIINQFQPLALRQDVGALWENYFLSERIKHNSYQQHIVESYFWRTYDGQEIDVIETSNNNIVAFECKWKNEKAKIPAAFAKAYEQASFTIVTQNNYLPLIGG
jgi:uncharacterized protein